MAHGFSITPERLRRSAGEVDELGELQSTELDRARGELSGSPAVWGSDEPGSVFGSAYGEATDMGFQALKAIATGLGDVAAALKSVADDTESRDQAIAEDLRRIQQR